jgi:hypothetical protein
MWVFVIVEENSQDEHPLSFQEQLILKVTLMKYHH